MSQRKGREPLPSCRHSGVMEAGCDEAGRGCLAGPVVAAAVILPDGYTHPDLRDSKKLSEKKRIEMRGIIIRDALAWAIAECSAEEIDRLNILNASIEAMHRALKRLAIVPGEIVVDGNKFKPFCDIPFTTVVKGDNTFANIAAASILAKTTRDAIMERLDEEFPAFGWRSNKGYPTSEHRDAIAIHGPSPYHRMTFGGVKEFCEDNLFNTPPFT